MTVDPMALKLSAQLHITMDPMAKDSSGVPLKSRTTLALKQTDHLHMTGILWPIRPATIPHGPQAKKTIIALN